MKVFVKIEGEWLVIPCPKGTETIQWLGEEAFRRHARLDLGSSSEQTGQTVQLEEQTIQVRKNKGSNAILDPSDCVYTVCNDDDFLSVTLLNDEKMKLKYENQIVMSTPFTDNFLKDAKPKETVYLDGNSLLPEDLFCLSTGKLNIDLTNEAWKNVEKSRKVVTDIVREHKVVYGITTGFGKFADVVIENNKLSELQENLIRSHAVGVGEPLSQNRTRMLLALRINTLAKGYSGISSFNLRKLIDAFNASCLSRVPEKGTVGASGDLAPLSHLALGLLGEGPMWSPRSGWADARLVLAANGLTPMKLEAKEGLALINGTQLITSLGCEALCRAEAIARQADVIAALTLEMNKGTTRAFDSDIHAARPHFGQQAVAERFRALLHNSYFPSEIAESHRFCKKVQDAYTLRCCPQVHGIVLDTIKFVRVILQTEMNSATDNPMVLSNRQEIVSAGNFHGEYPAKVLDYLAIGIHELANISERRIERLVNPAYSELPAFLARDGGLNSGFMMAHCTAASLVSENKVLCHPSSVDSISTSAGQEDHVSMGGFAARKCLTVIEHVETVLAIELLVSCQAIEFLRPLKTTAPLEAVIRMVRRSVPALDRDRFMAPDIEKACEILREEKVWREVEPYLKEFNLFLNKDDEGDNFKESRPTSPTATILRSRKRLASHCCSSNAEEASLLKK